MKWRIAMEIFFSLWASNDVASNDFGCIYLETPFFGEEDYFKVSSLGHISY